MRALGLPKMLTRLWHLAVLAGPDAGLILPVPTKGALGRGEVLTDPAVSRRHLTVTVEARAVRINDAGSANGTRVRRRSGGGGWEPAQPVAVKARSSWWATPSWSCDADPATSRSQPPPSAPGTAGCAWR